MFLRLCPVYNNFLEFRTFWWRMWEKISNRRLLKKEANLPDCQRRNIATKNMTSLVKTSWIIQLQVYSSRFFGPKIKYLRGIQILKPMIQFASTDGGTNGRKPICNKVFSTISKRKSQRIAKFIASKLDGEGSYCYALAKSVMNEWR